MNPQNQPNQPNPVPQGAPDASGEVPPSPPPVEANAQSVAQPQPPELQQPPESQDFQSAPSVQQPFQTQPQAPVTPASAPTMPAGAPQSFASQPPQVPQAPQQPQSPTGPAPMMPGSPVTGQSPMQPPGGSSDNPLSRLDKKILIWIGAGIGALLLITIAVLVVVSIFSVSRDDYKAAYSHATDAQSAYTKMSNLRYVSSYSTETQIENALDSFKKSQERLDQEIDELSETKAIQRDNKASELYAAFTEKKQAFDKATTAIVEVYEHVLPALSGFSTTSSSDQARIIRIVNTARSELEAAEGKLKSDVNKQFVGKMTTLFKRYAALAKKVQAYRADYSKYDSSVASDYLSTSTDITTAIRDWQSDIQKLAEDAEIKEEFNELSQYLAEKMVR